MHKEHRYRSNKMLAGRAVYTPVVVVKEYRALLQCVMCLVILRSLRYLTPFELVVRHDFILGDLGALERFPHISTQMER